MMVKRYTVLLFNELELGLQIYDKGLFTLIFHFFSSVFVLVFFSCFVEKLKMIHHTTCTI